MTQELMLSFSFAALAFWLWRGAINSRLKAGFAAVALLISLLLSGIYLIADSLSGEGISESVIFHLKAGVEGAAYGEFSYQFWLAALTIAGGITASVVLYKTAQTDAGGRRFRSLLAWLSVAASLLVNPATADLAFLYQQTRFESRVAPDGFLMPGPLEINQPPKNFVILYLEQVERSYFDESLFPGLMPNLKALEKEALSFTDITQARGTSWSIAGMTAGFCGLPLVGAAATNSMSGMDRFLPGATCIGDLLKAGGYQLQHLYGGDLDFGAWGNFFGTHGFDRVEGVAALKPLLPEGAVASPWGIHDEDLLALAEQRFDTLAAAGSAFGLTLNTLDTHHPTGYPGPYCDGIVYGDGESDYLNTLQCTDQLVAGFIRKLRAKPAFENTVLLVASDHLAMPNTIWDKLSALKDRRNLLMIFGADIEPALVAKTGSSFDVGTTLLNAMGIEFEGIGLGRNLMSDAESLITATPSLDDLILENTGFLTSLWSYPQLNDGVIIDTVKTELQLGDRSVTFPVLFTLSEDMAVEVANFDFYDGYPLPEKAANLWFYQRFFWVDSCARIKTLAVATPEDAGQYCAAAGALGSENIKVMALAQNDEIAFSELAEIFESVVPDEDVYTQRLQKMQNYAKYGALDVISYASTANMAGDYAIWSMGGYALGPSMLKNLDSGAETRVERGLTLFGLTPDNEPVKLAYIDTCAYEIPVEDLPPIETGFAPVMAENAAGFGAFIIILHDSALCSRYEVAPVFEGTRLARWPEIIPRSPYIALISGNGESAEFVGGRETPLVVGAQNFIALPD